MHKRSSGAITPQEQRMLIAVQTRINNLNTRLSANGKKINSMKEQMSHLKTEVEENDSTIAQMEHEEDILRMQFIEAKLQYEYEFRKKQISEKEAKHLYRFKLKRAQEELTKGWSVMKIASENEKLEAKSSRIIEHVNAIAHQVELLEDDVTRYEEINEM